MKAITRRDSIRIGVCGALGLSLSDLLRAEASGDGTAETRKAPAANSIIHLNLGGGFAAQESWDPKPESPAEYRGPVRSKKSTEHFVL